MSTVPYFRAPIKTGARRRRTKDAMDSRRCGKFLVEKMKEIKWLQK